MQVENEKILPTYAKNVKKMSFHADIVEIMTDICIINSVTGCTRLTSWMHTPSVEWGLKWEK